MIHDRLTLHRLFFALRVPLPLARRLAVASERLVEPGSIVAAERLHLTLFILDDRAAVDPASLDELRRVGAAVRLAPFTLVLERMVATARSVALRPRKRHAPLHELYDRLADGCRAAGIAPRSDHRFSPHVTLGYHPRVPRNEAVAPVGWDASELVLIDSHVRRTRHELLGRWPLAGEPPRQFSLF